MEDFYMADQHGKWRVQGQKERKEIPSVPGSRCFTLANKWLRGDP